MGGGESMTYYKLRCIDCNLDFSPLFSTNPDELLNPEYGDVTGGRRNMERLHDFHDAHCGSGHRKEAIPADA